MKLNIALTSIIFTELADTTKYGVGGGGCLIYHCFSESPFKRVSGDVAVFHRMTVKLSLANTIFVFRTKNV